MKCFWGCIFIMGCFIFTACPSPQPSFDDVRTAVIYDYESMEKAPVMRMAVFVRLHAQSQTNGTLTLSLPAAGYTWKIEKPSRVFDSDKGFVWLGSTNIACAPGTEFAGGEYRLLYTDKASMKAETLFFVQKPQPVKNVKLDAYKTERLAVFDAEGFLLGYNIEKERIARSEIAEKYPGAFYTRRILIAPDGQSLAALPSVPLTEEDGTALSSGGAR